MFDNVRQQQIFKWRIYLAASYRSECFWQTKFEIRDFSTFILVLEYSLETNYLYVTWTECSDRDVNTFFEWCFKICLLTTRDCIMHVLSSCTNVGKERTAERLEDLRGTFGTHTYVYTCVFDIRTCRRISVTSRLLNAGRQSVVLGVGRADNTPPPPPSSPHRPLEKNSPPSPPSTTVWIRLSPSGVIIDDDDDDRITSKCCEVRRQVVRIPVQTHATWRVNITRSFLFFPFVIYSVRLKSSQTKCL